MSSADLRAYKILSAGEWTDWLAAGTFAGAPVDLADGYIHLSTADQLAGTLEKHFAGQPGLVIAAIDLATLGDAVRWEPSRGGDMFPHVYSVVPISAVRGSVPLVRDGSGAVVLPG